MHHHFVQIVVRGADRAKFLHNFCTNNIKAMQPGELLEAFFVNVHAKVLAHGYIAAFEDHHAIWMLPGDPAALVKHLNRYVITEDVTIELSPEPTRVFRLRAEAHPETFSPSEKESGCVRDLSSGAAVIWFPWNHEHVIVIGGPQLSIEAAAANNALSLELMSADRIEHLRILERFPVVGVDLTVENLAPEADRNASAICYTKGCYLGQEPIARIDALGHVNKSLKRLRAEGDRVTDADAAMFIGAKLCVGTELSDDRNRVGTISSAVFIDGQIVALGMLRIAAAGQPLTVLTKDGRTFAAASF